MDFKKLKEQLLRAAEEYLREEYKVEPTKRISFDEDSSHPFNRSTLCFTIHSVPAEVHKDGYEITSGIDLRLDTLYEWIIKQSNHSI